MSAATEQITIADLVEVVRSELARIADAHALQVLASISPSLVVVDQREREQAVRVLSKRLAARALGRS